MFKSLCRETHVASLPSHPFETPYPKESATHINIHLLTNGCQWWLRTAERCVEHSLMPTKTARFPKWLAVMLKIHEDNISLVWSLKVLSSHNIHYNERLTLKSSQMRSVCVFVLGVLLKLPRVRVPAGCTFPQAAALHGVESSSLSGDGSQWESLNMCSCFNHTHLTRHN